jgi:hypothetical protein
VFGTGVITASASPPSVNFGNVPIGTTATQPVTVTADAGYQIDLASGTGINAPFSFAFGTCSSFTGPGSCTINQSFTPTAAGPASGTSNVFECPVAGGTCLAIPIAVSGDGV